MDTSFIDNLTHERAHTHTLTHTFYASLNSINPFILCEEYIFYYYTSHLQQYVHILLCEEYTSYYYASHVQ